MNRELFQELARLRLKEAQADAGCPDGAYYLAGYAVECALKACICRNINQYDFPPKPEVVRDVYSHKLPNLLKIAGLDVKLKGDAPQGSALDGNWAIVSLWSEESRYRIAAEQEARDLCAAIAHPQEGVLTWLQQNW